MRVSLFRGPDFFKRIPAEYRVLPFRFMRWRADEILITNDVGEFEFLSGTEFTALVSGRLPSNSASYRNLKAKHFLADSASTVPIELLATKYRSKRAFLQGFTKLHMFVVTLRCDHSCPYCQVSRVTPDKSRYDMTQETAERSIELMFRSPSPDLKVEFQGGESLLNFDLIRFIVEQVKKRNASANRRLDFVVATNLSPLTDEILAFCREHAICLSTSLDGPEWLHNANRPRPGGNSYQITVENLARARAVLGDDRVSALMTTTERSLQYPIEIVDEYVAQGFDHIFVRAISPYGFAVRTKAAFKYQIERFIDFYKTALAHIIELNRRGTSFAEVYTQILLQKMLTPFPTGYVDLQSPAGIGIGGVVYNYDGRVYASDEGRMLAEMGDHSFMLGDVHRDSYESIFGGHTLRALIDSSCLETMPGCSECALSPYCGADPVFHWTTQGDPVGHRPTSAFCSKNMAIIQHLFELMRKGDEFTRNLLLAWAVNQSRVPSEVVQ